MTTVGTKKTGVDYRCQDCGLVVTVKKAAKTTQHGELMCCNEPMKAD
jgi:desulfoferrodoxin-like iron-binding protein